MPLTRQNLDRIGKEIMERVSTRVNGDRLWRRLMDLAQFGATENGGVSRLALSSHERNARRQLIEWARMIGLKPSTDSAANLFLRLDGREPDLPPLLIGSHIDSQPTGGKFDGAYGVLSALEAVEAIAESGVLPRRSVEIVAWMNEEGSRFAPGMMGSAAFTGRRSLDNIGSVVDSDGISVRDAICDLLDDTPELERRPLGFDVAGFVEAHIEQGVQLERMAIPIGVVTGIQGKCTFRIEVEGKESHAGTTPRADRRDALVSAVSIIRGLQDAMWDEADTVRFTIGRLTVTPNAPSVVPGRVVFSIDLRHGDAATVRRLGDAVPKICARSSGQCTVTTRELLHDTPVVFSDVVLTAIGVAADRLDLLHMEMASPAGHDARYLHYVCPTGMIFIPCKDGISHNEAESITRLDSELGARLLADTAFELANSL